MTGSLFARFFLSVTWTLVLALVPLFSSSAFGDDDFYYELAKYHAPVIFQQTDEGRSDSDYITNYDFDGDFVGNNNWDNASVYNQRAYVYYSVSETMDSYYIFYGFFHPRRYSSRCFMFLGTCHENDFSGVLLVVKKDASDWGKLDLVETFIGGDFYTYQPNLIYQKGVHGTHNRLALWSRAKDHNLYVLEEDRYKVNHLCGGGDLDVNDRDQELMRQALSSGDGHLVYLHSGDSEVAETPTENMTQGHLRYKLLDIKTELFDKIDNALDFHSIFRKPFKYDGSRFGIDDHMVPAKFFGTKYSNSSSSFPWAWFDGKCARVRRGDWFFDPAYAVNTHLGRKVNGMDEYIYNPYLKIGTENEDIVTDQEVASEGN